MAAVFHLAYPVKDKELTRAFYADLLGCPQGREAETWIDFDFFGHQLSFHVKPEAFKARELTNLVDGKDVPVRHFGAVLDWDQWHSLRDRLIEANTNFVIDPYIRFKGETAEQATMFFLDPRGTRWNLRASKTQIRFSPHSLE